MEYGLMPGLKNGEKSIRWQECWNGCLNQLNMPDSYPMRIASMEFCTPSFLNRFCRWILTVWMLTHSLFAISLLNSPFWMRCNISVSRLVRGLGTWSDREGENIAPFFRLSTVQSTVSDSSWSGEISIFPITSHAFPLTVCSRTSVSYTHLRAHET